MDPATVLYCYLAVGVYVWLCGLGDSWRVGDWSEAGWLLLSLVAVVLGWPVVVWRTVRSWVGR